MFQHLSQAFICSGAFGAEALAPPGHAPQPAAPLLPAPASLPAPCQVWEEAGGKQHAGICSPCQPQYALKAAEPVPCRRRSHGSGHSSPPPSVFLQGGEPAATMEPKHSWQDAEKDLGSLLTAWKSQSWMTGMFAWNPEPHQLLMRYPVDAKAICSTTPLPSHADSSCLALEPPGVPEKTSQNLLPAACQRPCGQAVR